MTRFEESEKSLRQLSNIYVMPHKLTFHIRVCKTDFGHLPNKSLLKQGKLLLLLIFLFFPEQNID